MTLAGKKLIHGAIVAVVSTILCPLGYGASIFSFDGHLSGDDEQANFLFTLDAPEVVTLQTTSYATGGLAPGLSVFGLFGEESPLLLGQDAGGVAGGPGNPGCGPRALNPSTGLCLDAYLQLGIGGPLPAGQYLVILTSGPNFALGPTLAEGFLYPPGSGNFTGNGAQNGPFLDPLGNQMSGEYGLAVVNADYASSLGTPEPSGQALCLAGAALLVLGFLRKASRSGARASVKATSTAALSVIAVSGCFLLPPRAAGQTLHAAADTWVSQTTPTLNFGNAGTMTVGPGSVALIQVDVSRMIAAGVTQDMVQQATLVLFANRVVVAGSLDASLIESPWTESTVTYNTIPTAQTPFAPNIPAALSTSYLSIDVTAQVKSWLAGTPNYGIAITAAAGAPATALVLDAKENSATSHPAEIGLVLMSPGAGLPSGAVVAFATPTCPLGWSAMPQLAGRTVIGAGSGSGLTPRSLNDAGGEEQHTQSVSELPQFTVTIPFGASDKGGSGNGHAYSDGAGGSTVLAVHNKTSNPVGGGSPFNVMQPWYALNYCVKQ